MTPRRIKWQAETRARKAVAPCSASRLHGCVFASQEGVQ